MRKLVSVAVFALCAAVCGAQTIPELFGKAKEQIKAGSWKDALATLDALDAESKKPGNESVRGQLEAPLAFYRGVCQSNVGDADKAVAEFRTFLKAQPNATVDGTMYGKKTVAAFERAQKELAERPPSLAEAYKDFRPRPDRVGEPVDERWGDSPIRWILTDAQKSEWAAIQDPNARTDFVEKFWVGFASAPAVEGRTYRQEFERRVAFADANFAPDEDAGEPDGSRHGLRAARPADLRGTQAAALGRRRERRWGVDLVRIPGRRQLREGHARGEAGHDVRQARDEQREIRLARLARRRKQHEPRRDVALPPRGPAEGRAVPAGGFPVRLEAGLRGRRAAAGFECRKYARGG